MVGAASSAVIFYSRGILVAGIDPYELSFLDTR
jgi:hypothetical protein